MSKWLKIRFWCVWFHYWCRECTIQECRKYCWACEEEF